MHYIILLYWVSGSLRCTPYIIMVFMRCKFINDVMFIASLSAYKMHEPFWDHIFIMFVFILFYLLSIIFEI